MDSQPQSPPRRVALLYHPRKAATRALAEEISQWLAEQGATPWIGDTWDEATARARIPEMDLIVALGGDGSMLRAARMAAEHRVPLMGINMGRLGFLSEMTLQTWRETLAKALAGETWIEPRMMLRARARRGDKLLGEHIALNDIVISRGSLARVVWMRTEIDGDQLATYIADGLVISAPTGSTAYALAAGGPIMPPELHNILLIPIAAHLSLNRAIVLPEGSVITVTVGADHQAILTVDGQFEVELQNNDQIEVAASEHVSQFMRTGKRTYFYHTLLDRLGIDPLRHSGNSDPAPWPRP